MELKKQMAISLLSIVATSALEKTHPRFSRGAKNKCQNSNKLESTVQVKWTGSVVPPGNRKQQALTILNWYKDWLNDFPTRQSFKAQNGDMSGFMWVGSMVQNAGISQNVIPDFINEINQNGMPSEMFYEFLHENAMQGFGIILTVQIPQRAQMAVQLWSSGRKYTEYLGSKNSKRLAICYLDYGNRKPEVNDNEAGPCMNYTLREGSKPQGNVGEYLKAFNPGLDFNNLMPGQTYCYSEGMAPDLRPRKNSNGICATFRVSSGDTCGALAAKYSPLKVADIEKYNTHTYGWKGCNNLQVSQRICVSDGNPPRPFPNPKAECGPSAPAFLYNSQCPNKACCSDHGFCGLSSEFCSETNANGAPGTRGCYSNCGYGTSPARKASTFKRVAYWSDTSGGSYMDVNTVGDYDIVQYAFATISGTDLSIGVGSGFEQFKTIRAKKVVSFGGWEFSTNPSTYRIMRLAVSDKYRSAFARIVVNFLHRHNLDGVDFDWEYPEAPDIPNIPPGIRGDGDRYAKLLREIKDLDRSKTVSVAIPASYWYLKGSPLAKLDAVVDYFIFMNYDYVGQWDHGKPATGVGCHADRSLTEQAIKMIVKSGIDTTKVYGGSANYGRSFRLQDKNCKSYGCPFSGSPAMPGELTDTPGFSSIGEINQSELSESHFNATSKCFHAVFNNKQDWVAWMKESDIQYTEDWYRKDIGLGGSVLWVVNYYKTTYSEDPDTVNCYMVDGTIACDGQTMHSFDRRSHNRDNNPNNDSSRIFGEDYPKMRNVLRLLAYMRELIRVDKLQKKNKKVADYLIALEKCSKGVFSEIQKKFYKYTREEQSDSMALAYLSTPSLNLIKSVMYPVSMKTLNDRGPAKSSKFKKQCNPDIVNMLVARNRQLAPGVIFLAEEMNTSDSRLFNTVVNSDRPTVSTAEGTRHYGRIEFDHIETNQNQLYEGDVSSSMGSTSSSAGGTSYSTGHVHSDGETSSSDGQSDNSDEDPTFIYGESRPTITRVSLQHFDRSPEGNVAHPLYRSCLRGPPNDFDNCVRRLHQLIYDPVRTANMVHNANTQRELGSGNIPLYVSNMAGRSTGAACNALLYLLSPEGRKHVTASGLPYLTRGDGKSREYLTKYKSCPKHYKREKDEFPPASTKEGQRWIKGYRIHTAHVACIDKNDNGREGTNLWRFYEANVQNSVGTSAETQVDWSCIMPNTQFGGIRRGKIEPGDRFYVAVNIGVDIDCSPYMDIPRIRDEDDEDRWVTPTNGVRIRDTSMGRTGYGLLDHDELRI
ncbi:hypothetical protein JCM33374_g654 [Metschnikowia sp. JCM 33374]|nr:hypothetical protein JCM33374_g654 [Metschnikowia sp. JCM 33374]